MVQNKEVGTSCYLQSQRLQGYIFVLNSNKFTLLLPEFSLSSLFSFLLFFIDLLNSKNMTNLKAML